MDYIDEFLEWLINKLLHVIKINWTHYDYFKMINKNEKFLM